MNLAAKKCIPCEAGTLPMGRKEIDVALTQIPGWELIEGKKIRREWKFKNFSEAIVFVNGVAKIAEQEGHHPDILIHNWNRVRLELTTHAIGGLSENDFIVAAKMNPDTAPKGGASGRGSSVMSRLRRLKASSRRLHPSRKRRGFRRRTPINALSVE